MIERYFASPTRDRTRPAETRVLRSLVVALLSVVILSLVGTSPAWGIEWRTWSESLVAEAGSSKRLILVNGASKRCPWCRRMDADVFSNQAVQRRIATDFIPVRIDLNKRDQAPYRFQELVPPTTIILNGRGEELAKHEGYLDALQFLEFLDRATLGVKQHGLQRDPPPMEKNSPQVTETLSISIFESQLIRAKAGDEAGRRFVEEAISHALRWLEEDSEQIRLDSPKAVADRLGAVVILCRGYEVTGRKHLLDVARREGLRVHALLESKNLEPKYTIAPGSDPRDLLTGSGDTVRAFSLLYGGTGELLFFSDVEGIVSRQWEGTRLSKGKKPLSTNQTVQTGEGLVAVYEISGERVWLERASAVAVWLSSADLKQRIGQKEDVDGCLVKVRLARFANRLSRYTGRDPHRQMALGMVDAVNACGKLESDTLRSEVSQAQLEILSEPVHITVVGSKNDTASKKLWSVALRYNPPYLRREWWDRREGPLPNPDVPYPDLATSAAFVCANKRCSLPLFTDESLQGRISEMSFPL